MTSKSANIPARVNTDKLPRHPGQLLDPPVFMLFGLTLHLTSRCGMQHEGSLPHHTALRSCSSLFEISAVKYRATPKSQTLHLNKMQDSLEPN